jgi:hypothetical protein
MSYQIINENDLLKIEFNGSLNALDLIFLHQSQDYKTAIQNKKKMLIDFSGISHSQISDEDTKGLAMLGKMDAHDVKNLHLVIVVADKDADSTQILFEKVFADVSWRINIVESVKQANILLAKPQ